MFVLLWYNLQKKEIFVPSHILVIRFLLFEYRAKPWTQQTNHKLTTTKSKETHKYLNLVPETGDDDGNVFYKANDDDTAIDDKEGVVS